MSVLCPILYGLSAIALLYACIPPQKKNVRLIARPLMLILGVLSYLFCARSTGAAVVVALLFLCAGGILLSRQEKTVCLKAGYVCNSIGLIIYAVLCLMAAAGWPSGLFAVLSIAVYAVILFYLLYRLLPYVAPEMSVYVCLLTGAGALFSLCALLLVFDGGSVGSSLLLIGSFFWMGASCLHLHHRFKAHIPVGRFLITLLYVIAFTLIVFGSTF